MTPTAARERVGASAVGAFGVALIAVANWLCWDPVRWVMQLGQFRRLRVAPNRMREPRTAQR